MSHFNIHAQNVHYRVYSEYSICVAQDNLIIPKANKKRIDYHFFTLPSEVQHFSRFAHLEQVKVVHPEDLLCPLSVVDHPALGGHGGLLVEGLGVELGLDDLGNAAVACVRNNGCQSD